jgi:hypothetical protein
MVTEVAAPASLGQVVYVMYRLRQESKSLYLRGLITTSCQRRCAKSWKVRTQR